LAQGFVFRRVPQGSPTLRVTTDSILVRDGELPAAALGDGAVVLSLRAGAYFGFNRVGTEIWEMLAAPCRVGEIFHALAQRHEVDDETLARDVTPFLETLVEQHLLRVVEAGGTR
jgi:hypothetical protein